MCSETTRYYANHRVVDPANVRLQDHPLLQMSDTERELRKFPLRLARLVGRDVCFTDLPCSARRPWWMGSASAKQLKQRMKKPSTTAISWCTAEDETS
jgi:hypothetical protein